MENNKPQERTSELFQRSLVDNFGKEAADIIFEEKFRFSRHKDLIDEVKKTRRSVPDDVIYQEIIGSCGPMSRLARLATGEFSKHDLRYFSDIIEGRLVSLLQEHKTLKNQLSAHGQHTAGPDIDQLLIDWSKRYELAVTANIQIATKAIKMGVEIPTQKRLKEILK